MRLAVPAPFGVGTVFFYINGTLTSIAAVRSIAPNGANSEIRVLVTTR